MEVDFNPTDLQYTHIKKRFLMCLSEMCVCVCAWVSLSKSHFHTGITLQYPKEDPKEDHYVAVPC